MTDTSLRRSDETIATAGSEHLMGRFQSRMEAERVVRQLTELGVPSSGIAVTDAKQQITSATPKVHIMEGLVLGLAVGGLLGGLFGAIFAVPATEVNLMGQSFMGETAGAISGIGYGLLLGIVLGVIVGVLSKATAASPIADFDELNGDVAVVDVQVPIRLAPQARDILNAA